MKLLLLLGLSLLSFTPVKKQESFEKKCYFFCFSRSMNPALVEGKQFALYTDFYEITIDPVNFNKLAHAWGQFVDDRCMNKQGCTSDLNWYEDEKMARKVYAELVAKFGKKEQFISSRIAFPFEESLQKEQLASAGKSR